MYKIIVILTTCFLFREYFVQGKNYGQFNLIIRNMSTCKGPKRKDCAISTMKVKNGFNIDADFLVTESMSPTKGKVLAVSNGNEVLRLQINKPCKNLFMKPVMKALFNSTDDCVISKGHYVFTLDFQDVVRNYYGGMHLYGNWSFKSMFYGSDCNFSCTFIDVKINPRKE